MCSFVRVEGRTQWWNKEVKAANEKDAWMKFAKICGGVVDRVRRVTEGQTDREQGLRIGECICESNLYSKTTE